jgi:hypothetical protein
MRIPVEEALRYMGAAQADEATRLLAGETAEMLEKRLHPRYLWRAFRIARGEGEIRLEGAGIRLPGTLAEKMLAECGTAVLMVCTLGAEFDRMEREWQARDMARAAVLDACGSALAEAGCDAAEEEIAAHFPGLYRTDRFSPGYGDMPLTDQKPFFRVLDVSRRIGVSLSASGLMIPQKSVTAFIGVADEPQEQRPRGCESCAHFQDCAFRKERKSCGR